MDAAPTTARRKPISLTRRPAWKALGAHYKQIRTAHLRQLFADDPKRGERFKVEALGLYFDYSKNRISDETLKLLLQLAEESGLRERIDAMFRGEKINITEKRAVLHVALRAPKDQKILVDRTPASAFATSSTSVLADRTLGRSWPTRPSGITASAT